jgi:lysyl-tRNA synthetase class 2
LEDELIAQRRAKRVQWHAVFGDPLPDRFPDAVPLPLVRARHDGATAEELASSPVEVRAAGRLLSLRKMGKLTFAHLSERGVKLQLVFERQRLGEAYEKLGLMDIGDWIGAFGTLFRTKTGELTLNVAAYTPLQKCLRPLPEKWHGLTDVEQRYRQRHLDLAINPESVGSFLKRTRMIEALRQFMNGSGFVEVETPMLHPIAGGAAARPFVTHHNALECRLFLRIAPELYLKRLVVGGLTRVYEINRNFRNEGIDTTHNPEFTMMEFYWAFASASDMMGFTEALLHHVVLSVTGGTVLEYEGNTLDFTPPFKRLDLRDAAKTALLERGVPDGAWLTPEGRSPWIERLGMSPHKSRTSERFLVEAFETLVQAQLVQPTFVHDFPLEVSPLSRRKPGSENTVDRFELFAAGMELANGFSELNDPDDQRRRFVEQVEAKAGGDEEAMPYDEDYCQALEYGLPPTAGEGIGIDRLAMLLTGTGSIRDVVLFPLLKPRSSPEAP